MAAHSAAANAQGSSASRWTIRVFVLGTFALVVWLCGPRAAAVLAARFEHAAQDSPNVVLDHVGFVKRPEWADSALMLAMTTQLAPWLQDEVPILDEATTAKLRDGLLGVPWVRSVGIERVFPDRFRLQLELRRPLIAVLGGGGEQLCLIDREGVALPWVDTPLPIVQLFRDGGSTTMHFELGQPVRELRVRAAVAVAVEWREQVAPLVPGCPDLLEVDATNLGERWMRGRTYPEIRIKLRRDDGAGVTFFYDHPVDSLMPRVPARTKAAILGKVLAKYPGLHGLIAADLRLVNRWADFVQPREPGVPDPDGEWSDLDRMTVPQSGSAR